MKSSEWPNASDPDEFLKWSWDEQVDQDAQKHGISKERVREILWEQKAWLDEAFAKIDAETMRQENANKSWWQRLTKR
jgi:uncharacterized DUF497 family protein